MCRGFSQCLPGSGLSRAVIDIDDIDVSMQMSCIDIENAIISIHIDIVK